MAHVSGATPLARLDPHTRRFSVHPLQTFTRARGAEQLDGAWAAITGETAEARTWAERLAQLLGLHPFPLDDDRRALYHAGASMASNFLVTLYRAAARVVAAAGVPPEALVPLMTRTIENQFDLTGPIARGDWETVARTSRRARPRGARPGAAVSRHGRGDSAMKIFRAVADLRRHLRPRAANAIVGFVPTMGALHAGHVALFALAKRECAVVVASVFVNPTQFNDPKDLAAYPRPERQDAEMAEAAGVDVLFLPAADEVYPPDTRHPWSSPARRPASRVTIGPVISTAWRPCV